MVKELFQRVKGRTREALLNARTSLKEKRRRLRVDGERILPIEERDRRAVRECLDHSHARRRSRASSAGSRATSRSCGRRFPGWQLAARSQSRTALGLASCLRQHDQPTWPNEALRIVQIQHRMQAICPALLQRVTIEGQSFVLRELQPTEDRLQLEHWHGKLRPSMSAPAATRKTWEDRGAVIASIMRARETVQRSQP